MTPKQRIMYHYLQNHLEINVDDLQSIVDNFTRDQIRYMGGVKNWYLTCNNTYNEEKAAIEQADYKQPDADRTWLSAEKIKHQILQEKLNLLPSIPY